MKSGDFGTIFFLGEFSPLDDKKTQFNPYKWNFCEKNAPKSSDVKEKYSEILLYFIGESSEISEIFLYFIGESSEISEIFLYLMKKPN